MSFPSGVLSCSCRSPARFAPGAGCAGAYGRIRSRRDSRLAWRFGARARRLPPACPHARTLPVRTSAACRSRARARFGGSKSANGHVLYRFGTPRRPPAAHSDCFARQNPRSRFAAGNFRSGNAGPRRPRSVQIVCFSGFPGPETRTDPGRGRPRASRRCREGPRAGAARAKRTCWTPNGALRTGRSASALPDRKRRASPHRAGWRAGSGRAGRSGLGGICRTSSH